MTNVDVAPMAETPSGPKIRVITLVALIVAALSLPGIVLRHQTAGVLDPAHTIMCVFLAVNLLICYWEICLFFRRDYIEARTEFWRDRQRETGRLAAAEFFFGRTSLWRALSPTLWADIWATYAQYDISFAERKSFGFSADVGNGFVTLIPTLLLYFAFATGFIPAVAAGLLGLAFFWQQTYVTCLYMASFFIAGRQRLISPRDLWLIVVGSNWPWVVFPVLGIYISLRLVLDGSYAALGI